jgi:hypothetical protein
MNRVMNENYHLMVQEAAGAAFREVGKIMNQVVTTFLQKVPYDELFTKEH